MSARSLQEFGSWSRPYNFPSLLVSAFFIFYLFVFFLLLGTPPFPFMHFFVDLTPFLPFLPVDSARRVAQAFDAPHFFGFGRAFVCLSQKLFLDLLFSAKRFASWLA